MVEQGNIIDELSADHRRFEQLFALIEKLPPGDLQRKDYAQQAITELAVHALTEVQFFYPAVRRHLPDGEAVADKEIDDHAHIEQLMQNLERAEVGEPSYDALLEQLISQVRAHVQDEEHNLFPSLRTALTPQELLHLGEQARRAQGSAPDRPHIPALDNPRDRARFSATKGLFDRIRGTLPGRGGRT